MKVEEIKQLNSYINCIENRSLHLSDDEYLERFDEAKKFEIVLQFNGIHISIEDVPKEIAKSLLSSHLISWKMKVVKAKQALLEVGIEID